jgi:hypothetical protein
LAFHCVWLGWPALVVVLIHSRCQAHRCRAHGERLIPSPRRLIPCRGGVKRPLLRDFATYVEIEIGRDLRFSCHYLTNAGFLGHRCAKKREGGQTCGPTCGLPNRLSIQWVYSFGGVRGRETAMVGLDSLSPPHALVSALRLRLAQSVGSRDVVLQATAGIQTRRPGLTRRVGTIGARRNARRI